VSSRARGDFRAIVIAGALAATIALDASSARGADVEVTSTTVGQGYSVASPWGYQLERRRLLETLGFSLYHLQGAYQPGKDDYNVRVLFRVDADFGLGAHLPSDQQKAETDFETLGGNRYVPGLATANLDLMAAYVEGRNLANGYLSFRAGRQYVTDVLGLWSFDGALVRLHMPWFFDVEGYGGFEQRGGLALSTGRYEPQGMWRGSHADFDKDDGTGPTATDYPSFQVASYAPAFGVAIESSGPNWIHGRLTYRRVYDTGESITAKFPNPTGKGYSTLDGLRISSEKLGYAANVNKTDLGGLKGGFTYDFYNQVVSYAYGGIEAYLGSKVTVGLDADHYEPTFDADSIFNWFTHNPTTTTTARVEARFTREIDMSAQGGARIWGTEGDPNELGLLECAAERQREGSDTKLPEGCDGSEFETSGAGLGSDATGAAAAARDEANRTMSYVVDALGQLAARYRSGIGKLELRGMVQAGGGRGHRGGADLFGEKTFDGGRYALGARLSVYDFGDDEETEEDGSTTTFSYVLGFGFKPLDLAKAQVEFEHDMNERVGQRFRLLARLDVNWAR